jgi:hypothetical protein
VPTTHSSGANGWSEPSVSAVRLFSSWVSVIAVCSGRRAEPIEGMREEGCQPGERRFSD